MGKIEPVLVNKEKSMMNLSKMSRLSNYTAHASLADQSMLRNLKQQSVKTNID